VSEEEREYLNETIRSLNSQLVDALRERDEARREICENVAAISASVNAKQWAQERGWDCFKDRADD
jgi:ABC-type transporter Mla subunit MlaD